MIKEETARYNKPVQSGWLATAPDYTHAIKLRGCQVVTDNDAVQGLVEDYGEDYSEDNGEDESDEDLEENSVNSGETNSSIESEEASISEGNHTKSVRRILGGAQGKRIDAISPRISILLKYQSDRDLPPLKFSKGIVHTAKTTAAEKEGILLLY